MVDHYQNNITTLARRLRPLLLNDIEVSGTVIAGGDVHKIILYNPNQSGTAYNVDDAGLAAAIAGAVDNAIIWVPAGTFSNDYTIPGSVSIVGAGRTNTIFSGTLIMNTESALLYANLNFAGSSASNYYAVTGPSSGRAYIYDCLIDIANEGAGTSRAIFSQSGGTVRIEFSDIYVEYNGSEAVPFEFFNVRQSWDFSDGIQGWVATGSSEWDPVNQNLNVYEAEQFPYAWAQGWFYYYPSGWTANQNAVDGTSYFGATVVCTETTNNIEDVSIFYIGDPVPDNFRCQSEYAGGAGVTVRVYAGSPESTNGTVIGTPVDRDGATVNYFSLAGRTYNNNSNIRFDNVEAVNFNVPTGSDTGLVEVYAVKNTYLSTGEVQLWGDRSAHDVGLYPNRHASDINAGIYKYHVPRGTADGDMLLWSGSVLSWVTGTIAASGTASGGSSTIYDSGVLKGTTNIFNFTGDISATVTGGTAVIDVTAAGGGSIIIYDEAIVQGTVNQLNFTGDGVVAAIDSGTANITISGGTAGGGISTYKAAYASRPTAGTAGNLFFPTDANFMERDNGSTWDRWGPIMPMGTVPTTGWSWDNQGTVSVTAQYGGLTFYYVHGAENQVHLYHRTLPGTPYIITAAFSYLNTFAEETSLGMVWRQSSNGRLVTHGYRIETTANTNVRNQVLKWNSSASTSGTAYVDLTAPNLGFWTHLFLRIADDGTNRTAWSSDDGIQWKRWHSIGRTDHVTADQYGFFIKTGLATGTAGFHVYSIVEA